MGTFWWITRNILHDNKIFVQNTRVTFTNMEKRLGKIYFRRPPVLWCFVCPLQVEHIDVLNQKQVVLFQPRKCFSSTCIIEREDATPIIPLFYGVTQVKIQDNTNQKGLDTKKNVEERLVLQQRTLQQQESSTAVGRGSKISDIV